LSALKNTDKPRKIEALLLSEEGAYVGESKRIKAVV